MVDIYGHEYGQKYELTDENVKQAFALFDKGGSGSIQSCEFLDFMKSLGVLNITQFEAKLIFNFCDTDEKGKVTLKEIKEMWEKQYETGQENGCIQLPLKAYLEAMFRIADEDGKGYISRDELKDLLINGKQLQGANYEDDVLQWHTE